MRDSLESHDLAHVQHGNLLSAILLGKCRKYPRVRYDKFDGMVPKEL